MANSARVFTLLAALSLGGCGGGDDAEEPIGGAVSAARIDSQSAPIIASQVSNAIAGSQDLGAIGGFSVPVAPSAVTVTGKDVPQMLAATFGPDTVECAVSGELTVSGTQALPDSVTVGDTLIFGFSACDNGDGAVIDGLLAFEIVSFSGDLATEQITLTVSMTLEALQFGGEAAEGTIDGNLSFTIDTTNAPETFIALSSASFSIESPSSSETLIDYIATIAVDPMLLSVTIDSSATLRSSKFEGEISYVTTKSLVFTGDGAPVSGEIVVDGADGATLTISILSADHIELELDVDGNGTLDQLIVTSWSELLG